MALDIDDRVAARVSSRPFCFAGEDMDESIIEAYQPPSQWTPEHVLHRMICAFETLAATNENIGPKGYGSCMPTHLRDWVDELNARSAMDDEKPDAAEKRFNEDHAMRVRPRPTAHDVTLMLDAFAWPGRYLANRQNGKMQIARWAKRRAAKGVGALDNDRGQRHGKC